jgi:hypothetical protein
MLPLLSMRKSLMNMNANIGGPAMGELKTASRLLGDHEALNEAFERDGY